MPPPNKMTIDNIIPILGQNSPRAIVTQESTNSLLLLPKN